MTPNPNRDSVPLPFAGDVERPAPPPALSQYRDLRANRPEFAGAPDKAAAAATVSGWPRVFPGL